MHPIEAEDHAVGLVRYQNGAVGQFEVSWTFRGGMDLRDEVSGTEGTIWLNLWLGTGIEMFSAKGLAGYVAEKAEGTSGWLFPVGDEVGALGYVEMFADMFNAIDQGRPAMENFYDGFIVNAIMDAAYASVKTKQWEPVRLQVWRGQTEAVNVGAIRDYSADQALNKEETMPNGNRKLILRNKQSGAITEQVVVE